MARQLKIAGVDRWADLIDGTLEIEQVLTSQVDTCSFQVRGEQPTEGEDVQVIDTELGVLFAGVIDKVELAQDIWGQEQVWKVECTDYTAILDRKLVVETYENMPADDIVRDIVAKYGGGVFTTNNVRDGAPTVEYISFDYKPPSECFKELADYCGWDFYVGYDKDIWFFNPANEATPAPMVLEPGGYFRNLKHSIETTGLRNRVYVRGGTMLSDPWTYEVKADGSARAWVLPHKPHDLTVTVGGVAKTVGVENVDDEATKDFLMNYQEKYVRCSAQTPTPAQGTTISFTYRYDIDVITMVEDIASQQAIAAVQGGDGVYEHVIVDDSLTTIDAAEAAGLADLREHANPRVKGSFETEVSGWAPGQLVTINLPDRGITGTFLVQKVTITPCTPDKWTYRVEYGGRLLGIADWLQALWKAQQKKKLNETAVLHKFHYGAETAKVADEVQGTLRTPPWKVEQGLEVDLGDKSYSKTETTQADFQAGTLTNVVATAAGNLELQTVAAPTFSRSSVAYKSDGTQVAANVPRFETGKFGQAIMVEEGTTNKILYSEQFDASNWGKTGVTVTVNATIAPNGTTTADKITEDTSRSDHYVYQGFTLSSTSAPVAMSVYVKPAGRTKIQMYTIMTKRVGATFDLAALTATNYADVDSSTAHKSITPIGNGWYRIAVAGTASFSSTNVNLVVRILDDSGNVSYTGDGTSGFYLWGAQVEEKYYPTLYVPTTSATATRSSETLTIPTAGVLNLQEGTVECWVKAQDLYSRRRDIFTINKPISSDDRVILGYNVTGAGLELYWRPANATAYAIRGTNLDVVADWVYVGFRYKWNGTGYDLALLYNGQVVAAGTATNGQMTNFYLALLGCTDQGSGVYANYADMQFDDRRISNKARTDAEIAAAYASGQPLPVDEWTMYKLSLDGNLSAGKLGKRVSPVYDISAVSTAASSTISWNTTLPANTSLTVETNLSLDGGVTWQGWQVCTNGGAIPGITEGTDLSRAQLQIRQTLNTTDTTVTPQLHDVTVVIRPLVQFATVGGLMIVWQPGNEAWAQPQYQTSIDGITWSAWQAVDPAQKGPMEVPYPGYVRLIANGRVQARNWKKPFDQTDVVCGFVVAAS